MESVFIFMYSSSDDEDAISTKLQRRSLRDKSNLLQIPEKQFHCLVLFELNEPLKITNKMESNDSDSENNRFIYLLNIPIVRQQILQYLSIIWLMELRGVSRAIKLLMDEIYLPFELTIINGSMLDPYDMYKASDTFQKGFVILLTQTVHSLRFLDFDQCNWLTDNQLIDILKSNLNLNYLSLNYCDELSPTALHSIIVHGRNLKVVHLLQYDVDSESFRGVELEEIKWEELEISVYDQSYTYLARLLQKCEQLRALTLDLYNLNENITDIREVLRNCKNLKMLRIFDGINIGTDKATPGIFTYLTDFKNIENLAVDQSNFVTDNSLKTLSKWRNLKQLVFDECSGIETGLGYLTVCKNLQILSLNKNDWVTDDVLETLTRYRNLRKLHLVDCHRVTPTGISNLAKGCPTLEGVIVRSGEDHGRECFRILNVVVHVIDSTRHVCMAHGEHFKIRGIN